MQILLAFLLTKVDKRTIADSSDKGEDGRNRIEDGLEEVGDGREDVRLLLGFLVLFRLLGDVIHVLLDLCQLGFVIPVQLAKTSLDLRA